MNIAVTGEGVTDYGQQVFGEDKWEEGPVPSSHLSSPNTCCP